MLFYLRDVYIVVIIVFCQLREIYSDDDSTATPHRLDDDSLTCCSCWGKKSYVDGRRRSRRLRGGVVVSPVYRLRDDISGKNLGILHHLHTYGLHLLPHYTLHW
jgi:hypothetical protein